MKKLLIGVLSIVMCLSMGLSIVGCSNNDGIDAGNNEYPEIIALYNTYVAYAQENGTTPLSYEEWLYTIKGQKGDKGDKGEPGTTPTIEINSDGYWVINGVVTEHKAVGTDGINGTNGTNGTTPTIEINSDGYWVINGVVTEYKAVGKDGANGTSPNIEINNDGYLVVNGVVTEHTITAESIPKKASRNLAKVTWHNANIDNNGKYAERTDGINYTSTPEYIPVEGGNNYVVSCKKGELENWGYIFEYRADYSFIKLNDIRISFKRNPYQIQVSEECAFIRVKVWGDYPDKSWEELIPKQFQIEKGKVATPYIAPEVIDDTLIDDMALISKILPTVQETIEREANIKAAAMNNPLLKQIAHRGYRATGAPQCTAPAYITAKQVGYDAGENDLWVTADGEFVMAHNTTMPSDGTTVIAENTYETLLNCNMGTFNGKTIPIMTLEEWLILMKKIGLEAYIDLKSTFTEDTAAAAVAIVRKHGMLDKVTWSGSKRNLTLIRKYDATARIAFLSTTAFTDTYITESLKPFVIEGKPNLTVVYTQSIYVTAEYVEAVHNAGLSIECWHCDYSAYGFETEEEILAEIERVVNLGVTGICLDTYLPCEYFINKLNEEWGI